MKADRHRAQHGREFAEGSRRAAAGIGQRFEEPAAASLKAAKDPAAAAGAGQRFGDPAAGARQAAEDPALAALLASPKYRGIFPGAVERVYREQMLRHRPRDAAKAARAELHRIAGAFLTANELKRLRGCLERARSGDGGARFEALALHASTRERLPEIDALYERAFRSLGRPKVVADLACGLNPLYLGAQGIAVRGIELNVDAAQLVNDWAAALGWDVWVEPGDLAGSAPLPEADLTLLMKLLPLLDKQMPGGGMALLARVRSPRALATFPTRTLSGRNVGMRGHYETSFEQNLPPGARIADKFVAAGELCYALELSRV